MKLLFRVLATAALFLFILITVIKVVQKCSYKDAVGIAEQLWREIYETAFGCCSSTDTPEA